MKTMNVRELRAAIPRLKEELAAEHELVLVSNGEPIARIVPVAPMTKQRPKLQSLAEHRAQMPMLDVPTEDLIREDRDRRGT